MQSAKMWLSAIVMIAAIGLGCGESASVKTPRVVVSQAPNAPTNVVAQAKSPTSVQLTWKDESDNETGFRILRRNLTLNQRSFPVIATVAANTTTYTDTAVSPSTQFVYRVDALNSYSSGWSLDVTVLTPKGPNKTWEQQGGSITANPLNDVWGSTSNDVWAVGDSGTIYHYDGTAWSLVPVTPTTTENLTSIWGSTSNDVWAVGDMSTIYHYDGTTWSAYSISAITQQYGLAFQFKNVFGFAADDAWIAGWSNSILHWNGVTWSMVSDPNAPGNTSVNTYTGIWGAAGSDVWFVGGNPYLPRTAPVISRYKNGTLTPMVNLPSYGSDTIWGSGPNDVWVVGYRDTATANTNRFNGTTWTPVTIPLVNSSARPYTIWGLAANNVWVADSAGGIQRYDGMSWTVSRSTLASPNMTLVSFWGFAPDDVWVVGKDDQNGRGIVFHYE